jgi:hypothetical protein
MWMDRRDLLVMYSLHELQQNKHSMGSWFDFTHSMQRTHFKCILALFDGALN